MSLSSTVRLSLVLGTGDMCQDFQSCAAWILAIIQVTFLFRSAVVSGAEASSPACTAVLAYAAPDRNRRDSGPV